MFASLLAAGIAQGGPVSSATSKAVTAEHEPRPPRPNGLAEFHPVRGLQGRIEGSAPAILPALARRWTERFMAVQPGLQVAVPPPYEPPQGALSPRLTAFLTGRLDFAFLTRALAESDVQTFRRAHGYDPLVIAVANGSWRSFGFVDPVAVVVNGRNPIRSLSYAQLDAVFSATRRRGHPEARTWGDLSLAGWRERPIHIVGGADWQREDSARGIVFRERVLLGGQWRRGLEIDASGREAEVSARVAADPLAIGFTGLGHVLPGTRAVPIDSGGAAVAPSFDAVRSGRYPLTRTIDLVLARRPGACLSPKLLAFVRFLLSRQGQEAVVEQPPFLPLTVTQAREGSRRAASCR